MNAVLKDICIICFRLSAILPDDLYLKIVYRLRVHKKLHLDNPTTFTEKIQRMKLEDHNPLYPVIADKYAVRKFVADRIGEEYLIPLYGVYSSENEIPFEKLPNEYVLKATHDSGGMVVVPDKNQVDIKKVKKKLRKCLKRNFYWKGREWCYKDIKPGIICEELLRDPVKKDLYDYKIYCFHGKPKMVLIASERGTKTKYDFFDTEFHPLDLRLSGPNSDTPKEKPKNYEKMLELAEKLSDGFQQVRVDFYNIEGRIYFGEMTLYDSSGLDPFDPDEWDTIVGSWW